MKKLFIICILLLTSIPFIIPVIADEDWTIIGDTVFIDDSRAYLSATPHTIGSSGWVEFTLISKLYSGDIDVVWGFDRTKTIPSNPQIWANYTHTLWRWIEVEYVNETTGDPYLVHEKEYYESTFYDWKPLNKELDIKRVYAKGMDTWYVLKEVNVVADREYKVRCWIDVPFSGLGKISGKYAWGVKLSSDTIQEAITSDRFYFMDPWYDSLWLERKALIFNSSVIDEPLSNFTVLVHLTSLRIKWADVQDDLDDLRFTSDDKLTLLSYEIENYTVNDEAWIWVKIPSVSNTTNTEFFMYYDNVAAGSGEDKVGTWDNNFVMVQHMVDDTVSTVLDSTQYDNDGTKGAANGPQGVTTGQIDSSQTYDGVDDYINLGRPAVLNFSGTNIFTLSAWAKWNGSGVANMDIIHLGGYEVILVLDPLGSNWMIWFHDGVAPRFDTYTSVGDGNTWVYVVGRYNSTHLTLYRNGVPSTTPTAIATNVRENIGDDSIGAHRSLDRFFADGLDEVRISNVSRSDAWIKASYESGMDTLLTYGYPPDVPVTVTTTTTVSDTTTTLTSTLTSITTTGTSTISTDTCTSTTTITSSCITSCTTSTETSTSSTSTSTITTSCTTTCNITTSTNYTATTTISTSAGIIVGGGSSTILNLVVVIAMVMVVGVILLGRRRR